METFRNIKLIIFDLDGTLIDSSQDITNALNYAAIPYGFKPLAVEDTVKMVGEGITRLIEKMLGEDNAQIRDEVIDRFIEYYTEHITDFTKPYPGIKETLEKLRNYKKAVISNKREILSKKALEQLGLLNFFDIVLGSDSVPEKKPSPLPIKKTLEALKILPEEAIIVGDSDSDIRAGKAAGITTIAVTYGYRSRDVLKDADFIIDDILQLLPLITEKLDRRKEARYPVPEIYRHYIVFKVRYKTDDFIPSALLDFSHHGIKLSSRDYMSPGSIFECLISVPASLTREIRFKARVRYITGDVSSGFVVGAEIIEVADELWFNIFRKVHDFIYERMGEVF